MVAEVCSIDLHLQDIGELLVSPEPDPFQERTLRSSGMEDAASFLRIKGGKARARLNIHHPAERWSPDGRRRLGRSGAIIAISIE